MTVYIRPNGDDENDGSENAPVKSPKRAIVDREPEQGAA